MTASVRMQVQVAIIVALLLGCSGFGVSARNSDPRPETNGGAMAGWPATVWPQPATMTTAHTLVPLQAPFSFRSAGKNSSLLSAAFSRYQARLGSSWARAPLSESLWHKQQAQHAQPAPGRELGELTELAELVVTVMSATTTLDFDRDESYTLKLEAGSSTAVLNAESVWGAMRGLETFVQLAIQPDGSRMLPSTLSVADGPRFAYRGLMIDTARHYMPLSFLQHIVDAMEYNKLSVLHWHITDDESFPIQSTSFPKLSSAGAFCPSCVYTHADVGILLDYARQRGVMVIPEFDQPAHCASWGDGYPQLLVNCSSPNTHGDTLNPIANYTYSFLHSLLTEMAGVFEESPFMHLGGDEVPSTCWASDPAIGVWMKEHGITTFDELESYFVLRVLPSVTGANKTPMYWEEVFNNNVHLPAGTIIEAWKSNVMPAVVKAGLRTVNAFKWYLNHGCDLYGDGLWQDFYENDPMKFVPGVTPAEAKRVMGGETTMWNVCVDKINFDQVVWPRAAAAAEQLWSPAALTRNATAAQQRMAIHRCRLLDLGVLAAPLSAENDPRDSPCQ